MSYRCLGNLAGLLIWGTSSSNSSRRRYYSSCRRNQGIIRSLFASWVHLKLPPWDQMLDPSFGQIDTKTPYPTPLSNWEWAAGVHCCMKNPRTNTVLDCWQQISFELRIPFLECIVPWPRCLALQRLRIFLFLPRFLLFSLNCRSHPLSRIQNHCQKQSWN